MCWSVLLFTLRESAEEEALKAQKRDQRKAEKERAAQEIEASVAAAMVNGGVLGSDPKPQPDQNDLENKLDEMFRKMAAANGSWLTTVIKDATDYAKTHSPRTKKSLSRMLHSQSTGEEGGPQSLGSLFAANLWPSLKSRGWTTTEDVDSGNKLFVYDGKEVR